MCSAIYSAISSAICLGDLLGDLFGELLGDFVGYIRRCVRADRVDAARRRYARAMATPHGAPHPRRTRRRGKESALVEALRRPARHAGGEYNNKASVVVVGDEWIAWVAETLGCCVPRMSRERHDHNANGMGITTTAWA